jgi:hypothetical protein
VAVQVAGGVKPDTVKFAESAGVSVASPSTTVTVPLEHVSETVTAAPELSEKSLLTLKFAPLSVFTIVQDDVPPMLIETLAQAAWLTV